MYIVNENGKERSVLADIKDRKLVWPKSSIPFLNEEKLEQHPDKIIIRKLISRADNGDKDAIASIWNENEIINLMHEPNYDEYR